jgi:metal-sulfur cluster biosynthetic enzyme
VGSTLFRLLTTLLVVAAGVIVLSLPFIIAGRRLPALSPIVYADSGYVEADSLPLDSSRAAQALASVEDPELQLPISHLGLVHRLSVNPRRNIEAIVGLTTPRCPRAAELARKALMALQSLPGAGLVRVTVDPSLPWNPSMATDAARDAFRRFFESDTGRRS